MPWACDACSSHRNCMSLGSPGSCYLPGAGGSPDSWRYSSQTYCVSDVSPCSCPAHHGCSGTATSLPESTFLPSNTPFHGRSREQGHTQHPGSSGDGGREARQGSVQGRCLALPHLMGRAAWNISVPGSGQRGDTRPQELFGKATVC